MLELESRCRFQPPEAGKSEGDTHPRCVVCILYGLAKGKTYCEQKVKETLSQD
jgi:hypothetical protein